MGAGGAAMTGAGLAMIFAGNTEAVSVTGVGGAIVGGGGALIGGGIASGASLSAAYNLRSAGLRVSTAPGWIGAGLMVGSIALTRPLGVVVTMPAFAVGLVVSGLKVHTNARAKPTRVAMQPWIDPSNRQLGIAGVF